MSPIWKNAKNPECQQTAKDARSKKSASISSSRLRDFAWKLFLQPSFDELVSLNQFSATKSAQKKLEIFTPFPVLSSQNKMRMTSCLRRVLGVVSLACGE
jgi:hypothetical protein